MYLSYRHLVNLILSCSTPLNMKFILPINVKMPFMGRINTCTASESFKARKSFFSSFKFLQAIEISCSVELSMKEYITLGPGHLKLTLVSVSSEHWQRC